MKEELLPSIIVTNLSAGTNQTLNPPSHTWSFSRFLISVNGTTIHAVMQARRQKSALYCPLLPPSPHPIHHQVLSKGSQTHPTSLHLPHTALGPCYYHLSPGLLQQSSPAPSPSCWFSCCSCSGLSKPKSDQATSFQLKTFSASAWAKSWKCLLMAY